MTDVEKGEIIPEAEAAVPVAAAATDIPMRDQEKLGAKCCGCFCDYRRAVVVISIIFMIVCLIDVILFAISSTTVTDQSAMNALAVYAIIAAIFFFVNLFALVAALRYSLCMLSTVVLLILIEFGLQIYEITVTYAGNSNPLICSIIGAVIGYGLYLYPVVGLILEIKSGVMSKETYPREAYSCCCQPKV